MDNSNLKVEELSLAHLTNAQKNFDLAVREVHQVLRDIEDGILEETSKVTLTLTITFEPQKGLDGIDINCQGSLKLPKYPAESVHALRRLGKLKVIKADQAELPGIKGMRTIREVVINGGV